MKDKDRDAMGSGLDKVKIWKIICCCGVVWRNREMSGSPKKINPERSGSEPISLPNSCDKHINLYAILSTDNNIKTPVEVCYL